MPSGKYSAKTGKFDGVKSKRDRYNLDYSAEWAFLVDVMAKNGVPVSAIIPEKQALSTRDNALFSREKVETEAIAVRKAILCCKSFHARRSLMYYQFAFPEVHFIVHPVPYYQDGQLLTKENWYQTEAGYQRIMGEVRRCSNQFDDFFEALRQTANSNPLFEMQNKCRFFWKPVL
mgnify:CR=1 FL=1